MKRTGIMRLKCCFQAIIEMALSLLGKMLQSYFNFFFKKQIKRDKKMKKIDLSYGDVNMITEILIEKRNRLKMNGDISVPGVLNRIISIDLMIEKLRRNEK